jgi:hypothetical protein
MSKARHGHLASCVTVLKTYRGIERVSTTTVFCSGTQTQPNLVHDGTFDGGESITPTQTLKPQGMGVRHQEVVAPTFLWEFMQERRHIYGKG